MKHDDVYEKITSKIGLKEDKEYKRLYNPKDLYGEALGPLSVRNFKRFIGVLYYLVVEQKIQFDLIVGAGDSGIALTKVVEMFYELIKLKIPQILNMPITRFKYGFDLYDNSILIPDVKNELVNINRIESILFVDDEIANGTTLKAAIEVLFGSVNNSSLADPVKVYLVAEDQNFKAENFIDHVQVEMYPFAKEIEGLLTVIRYITPWSIQLKIREHFNDHQIGSKSLINLLLDVPIKETEEIEGIKIPNPKFTYKERDLLKKEVPGFEKLQQEFKQQTEKWIKEAVDEYNSGPDATVIELRSYRSEEDIKKIVQIHRDCSIADQIDKLSSLENVPDFQEVKENLYDDHCNPQTDIVITEINNRAVGYTKISYWNESNGIRLFLIQGMVVPKFRNQGIGTKQLKWAEKRAREIDRELTPSTQPMFGANASTSQADRIKFLEENGYSLTFSMVEMENSNISDTPTVSVPNNFETREVKSDHLRRIWQANNEVYEGRDFTSDADEEDYQDFVNDPSNDYSLWKVAWNGEEVAGLVLSKVEKGRGEITQVSVLPKYRRKGLAQALLSLNLKELVNKGTKTARLHTSGENVSGAQNLYQNAGFKILKRFNRYRKPLKDL